MRGFQSGIMKTPKCGGSGAANMPADAITMRRGGGRGGRIGRADGADGADGLVAELGAAAGHELLELGPDGVVEGRRLVLLERLGVDIPGPGRRILAALLQ